MTQDYFPHILKITEIIDGMGLDYRMPPIQRHFEKPNLIQKPLDLAPLIEHTLLKPEATRGDILKLCDDAKRFQFRGVCVNPVFVREAKRQLTGTNC